MKILLADNDKLAHKLYLSLLEGEGFEVITTLDGLEAIRKTYEENPDILILDVIIPKMNGYQVCRLLKNNKKYRHIPIMMVTAKTKKTDIFWGHECGADYYLTKPFDERYFLEKIKEIVRKIKK